MSIILQDVILAWRQGQLVLALAFMFICVSLLPLGLGANLSLLQDIAGGFSWLALLLALFLSLDRIFQADYEDGRLDHLMLSGLSLEAIALAKSLAHFGGIMLPLILMMPLAGVLLNMELAQMPYIILAMFCAAPALSGLGSIAAALAVSLPRAQYLIILFMMPLCVPLVIFGANIVRVESPLVILFILAGFSFVVLCLAPLAAASALRAAL